MYLLITCKETTTALECDLTCLLSLELTVCDNCCNAAMSELSFERSCLIDWVKSCISRAGSPNKLLPLATVTREIKPQNINNNYMYMIKTLFFLIHVLTFC